MTRTLRPGPLLALLALAVVALGAAQLTQGDAAELTRAVLVSSRVPRLLAALLVGGALGMAGTTLQGLTRNPLASPDTLGVNAGAYLALTAVAAFGVHLGALTGTAVALVGGLLAAALVLALGRGGSSVRLVLGGSVLALALGSLTSSLLILHTQQTQGLFAWGAGSLAQPALSTIEQLAVPMVLAGGLLVALGRRLDLLQLGDDSASALGLDVARTRMLMVVLAVLLAAGGVALTGPIGFVGLCAPSLARALARWTPALRRHGWLLSASALVGAVVVLASDVLLRAVVGATRAVDVPTGVVTTLVGAVFLVVLSHGMRTGSADDTPAALSGRLGHAARHPLLVTAVVALLVVAAAVIAVLFGDSMLYGGDLLNWLQGIAPRGVVFIIDTRLPRMLAALLAGAALALAGALTQTVTRNPLADPGVLGVAGGAGVGALVTIILGGLGAGLVGLGALAGAVVAALLVFGMSARGGWQPTRLVLVGLGVQAATSAVTTLLMVATDPWNQARALTWLGGSTYGAQLATCWPIAGVLVMAALGCWVLRGELDLVQLDDLTPRLLGVDVPRTRLVALALAVALTAAATSGVGVVSFVGLVAPHAARMLVGSRHARLLPLAALLGALLVVVADTVGRTLLAPSQLPVGVVCALVGVPWFCWLLWRMRAAQH